MWIIILIALLVIFIPKHGSYLDDENEKLIYADSDESSEKDKDDDAIGAKDLNSKLDLTKDEDTDNKKEVKSKSKKQSTKNSNNTATNKSTKGADKSPSTSKNTTNSNSRPDVSAIKNPIKSSGIKETEKSINDAEDIIDRTYKEGTK